MRLTKKSIKKLNLLLPFLLQRYYAPLVKEGKVTEWKVYFQDESRFGLMTVLRRAITVKAVKPILPAPLYLPLLLWLG